MNNIRQQQMYNLLSLSSNYNNKVQQRKMQQDRIQRLQKQKIARDQEKLRIRQKQLHIKKKNINYKTSRKLGINMMVNKPKILSKKEQHRNLCMKYLPVIRNINIPEFKDETNVKETILIEFRVMPHLEYLVRRTILTLNNWNHTIVCGNNNYDMIHAMCELIHKDVKTKIKIIKLDVGNMIVSQYSDMLKTKTFWDRFVGEKLLLYQEDTLLFHGNIARFLQYDYVGAPWRKINYASNSFVGNGGFSLRSKSVMLSCISLTSIHEPLPEDVYFAKTITKYNVGNIAPKYIAKMFSQEQELGDNPVGGHAYWLANNNIDENFYKIN